MNQMKSAYVIAAAVVLILLGALYFGAQSPAPVGEPSPTGTPAGGTVPPAKTGGGASAGTKPAPSGGSTAGTTASANSGRVIVAVTDAAVNLEDVKSVFLTVSQVRIQSPQKGWITIPGGSKKFDLLELKRTATLGLIGDGYVERGSYNQLWLTISEVSVLKYDGTSALAKLPSGSVRIVGTVQVERGQASSAVFDFDADKSLHSIDGGGYIFMPVIKLSTRANAIAEFSPGSKVRLTSGASQAVVNVGMDENGDVRENFSLHPLTRIGVVGNALKLRPYDLPETGLLIDAERAVQIATGGGYVDKVVSLKLTKTDFTFWRVTGMKGVTQVRVDIDAATGKIIER